jgi:hypothetical protein
MTSAFISPAGRAGLRDRLAAVYRAAEKFRGNFVEFYRQIAVRCSRLSDVIYSSV